MFIEFLILTFYLSFLVFFVCSCGFKLWSDTIFLLQYILSPICFYCQVNYIFICYRPNTIVTDIVLYNCLLNHLKEERRNMHPYFIHTYLHNYLYWCFLSCFIWIPRWGQFLSTWRNYFSISFRWVC